MLRIHLVAQGPDQVVLGLEGWLSGRYVESLREEGEGWLAQNRRLVLDLDRVRNIDRAGLDLLKGWTGDRLELLGGSAFLRLLLKAHLGSPEGADPI